MDADHRSDEGRQPPDVDGEESRQGDRGEVATATQDLVDEVAEKGNGSGYGCGNRGRPISPLVPWEQVTGEAHAQGEQEQEDACDPGELSRVFISAEIIGAQHVKEDSKYHQAGAPMMNASDKPAEADSGHDVLNAIVGMIGGGDVVDGEHYASDALEGEKEQAGTAEGEPPVDFGDLAVEDRIIDGLQTQAFI